MGGETLAAENEVELEVLVVRSRPSCLMLSSTGWAAVTSFQSCWRSEGHTAAVRGESTRCQQGEGAAPTGTHAYGRLGTPRAPSLPSWHSLAPQCGPRTGKSLPEAGHSPRCWHPGRSGCTVPSGTPKHTACTPQSCPRQGGDPSSLHPGTSSKEAIGGLILHTTQLKLSQTAPAVNAIRPQTLDGRSRNSNAPAPSPAPQSAPLPPLKALTLGQGLQGHGALSWREAHQPLALQV